MYEAGLQLVSIGRTIAIGLLMSHETHENPLVCENKCLTFIVVSGKLSSVASSHLRGLET